MCETTRAGHDAPGGLRGAAKAIWKWFVALAVVAPLVTLPVGAFALCAGETAHSEQDPAGAACCPGETLEGEAILAARKKAGVEGQRTFERNLRPSPAGTGAPPSARAPRRALAAAPGRPVAPLFVLHGAFLL